ncbi:MAG: hypothetical protein Q9214_007793, partial [Letrouitia sp. 1 TL-2023]
SIAADAQKRRNESLPQSYLLPPHHLKVLPRNVTAVATNARHFTTEELEIINSQAEDILIKVRERIWTALEVTEAFCKAATVAQQLVRPLYLSVCGPYWRCLFTKIDELSNRNPLFRSH